MDTVENLLLSNALLDKQGLIVQLSYKLFI
jgi:hypothetical protein